jgi:hypothetical protein
MKNLQFNTLGLTKIFNKTLPLLVGADSGPLRMQKFIKHSFLVEN